jgi:hypothetical protein
LELAILIQFTLCDTTVACGANDNNVDRPVQRHWKFQNVSKIIEKWEEATLMQAARKTNQANINCLYLYFIQLFLRYQFTVTSSTTRTAPPILGLIGEDILVP